MGIHDRAPDAHEIEREVREMKNALTALHEAIDSGNTDTQRNAQKALADYEDNTAGPRARQAALDHKRLDALERAVATGAPLDQYGEPNWPLTGYGRDTPEYKSFFNWLKAKTADALKDSEVELKNVQTKTLRTDSDPAGGYLIPQVMDAHIRKNIIEMSPVRAHARVRILHSKSMDIPRRLSVPIAQYEGEGEDSETSQAIYGSEQVTAYRQTVTIPATLDMMVSSAFDLETEIAYDCGESFGQGEALNFVRGNGRKCPQGFISDARCVSYTSGTSANFTHDDLAKMAGSLKRGQNPWWYFNRKTLAYIQTLKSSIGVPIWQPVAGNQPATIWGLPYDSNMIDLDDATAGSGAKPVVCADLFRGYEIFDLLGISVVRDDLTNKKAAITEWTFRRYNTGRVVLPEAIAVMTLL